MKKMSYLFASLLFVLAFAGCNTTTPATDEAPAAEVVEDAMVEEDAMMEEDSELMMEEDAMMEEDVVEEVMEDDVQVVEDEL